MKSLQTKGVGIGEESMVMSVNDCIKNNDPALLLDLVRSWWLEKEKMTFDEQEVLVTAWLGVLPELGS